MYRRKAFLVAFLFFTTIFTASFNPINPRIRKDYWLFFDLGDVLISPSKAESFNQNRLAFIKYVLKFGRPNSKMITRRLFELIDHQTGYPPRGTATNNGEHLPALMCDWLEGKVDSNYFVDRIISIEPNDPFFKNSQEGRLLITVAKMMLPENMVKIHKVTKLVDVLQRCKKHDASRVAILSNMDRDVIPLLKESFPEIFEGLRDNQIIFSGECGCKKPDEHIYNYAMHSLNLFPNQCVLIDDQSENIIGAFACGWHGIWHQDYDITMRTIESCYGFPCS